jgi:hypothetical protein
MEYDMRKRICKLAFSAMGAMLGTIALAADVRPVALFGASYRGDDLQVATTAKGDPVAINGVGKLQLGIGAEWSAEARPMSVRLMLSRDVDKSARSTNGRRDSFVRTPLEATVYYTGLDSVRFGVSLGYAFSPTAKATVDGRERSVHFQNAISRSFEIGYRLTPDLWASLRLTGATYKPKDGAQPAGAVKNDVTHLAVSLAYLF